MADGATPDNAPSGAVATTLPAWDVKKGTNVEVTPEELTKRFLSGDLHVLGNTDYSLIGPTGEVYDAPGKSVGAALTSGYRFATREEVAAHDAHQPGQAWRAGLEGAAEAIPGGKAMLVGMGADPVDMKAREEAHPAARMTGLGVGLVGGTALLGAAELPTLGTMLGGERAAAAAAAALGETRAATTLGRMATAAAGAAPEGAVYGAGNLANESALGDANWSAEALLAHAGTGAFLGAALGGAAGAFGKGAAKALPAISDAGVAAAEANATGGAPEGWFGRERGASPASSEPRVPGADTAADLRNELQRQAMEYVPGKGWMRPGSEDVTAPDIARPPSANAFADTMPVGPPSMAVDTQAPTRLMTRPGELEPPSALAAREPTMEGEVLASRPAPKALGPGAQRDVFDMLQPKEGAESVLGGKAGDSLNLSGAFGEMEANPTGSIGHFGQRLEAPAPVDLTPEQRELWDHYQNFGRYARPGVPEGGSGYVPGGEPNFTMHGEPVGRGEPYREPIVTPAPGTIAPDPGGQPGAPGMPAWLKDALLDAAAYHVAGPLGPVGRRALGAYMKSSPGAAAVVAQASSAVAAVASHIDRALQSFVKGGEAIGAGAASRRAVTAATSRMLLAKSPEERRAGLEARIAELSTPVMPQHISVPQPLVDHTPNAAALMAARVGAVQQQLLTSLPEVPRTTPSGKPKVALISDEAVRRFAAVDAALQDPLSVADTLAKGQMPHPAVLPAVAQAYPALYTRMQQAALHAMVGHPDVSYRTAVHLQVAFGLGGHALLDPAAVGAQQTAIAASGGPQGPAPAKGGGGSRPKASARGDTARPKTDELEQR